MSSKNRSKKKSSSNSNVRVMVKFGWNGSRIPVPASVKLTTNSSLMDVIESIQTSVPSVIFEGLGMEIDRDRKNEPTLLHMRNCVERSQWNETKLEHVGVDESSGSALLTLNLGGVMIPNTTKKPTLFNEKVKPSQKNPSSSNVSSSPTISDINPYTQPPTESQIQQQQPPTLKASALLSPTEALEKLISSHFDADSRECVKTLMKVIDNIIHKPGQTKTRSIKLSNPAFWKKVGSKSGGVEFLLACGFTPETLNATTAFTPTSINIKNNDVVLELKPENESDASLFAARQLLHKYATDLQIPTKDIPPLRPPTKPQNNTTTFDPFKSYSFNAQVNISEDNGPSSSKNDKISETERKLQVLNERAKRLEANIQKKPLERCWQAFLPGQSQSQQNANIALMSDTHTSDKVKGDGALLARRMKQIEEERKKREAGFTTKAMRDLEKMKKAKLFTHAQLRFCFPDGISVSANFYPKENIASVQNLIKKEIFLATDIYDFDLYVTPPRRNLSHNKTLLEEELLPAARIFISWKKGKSPASGVEYIKPELFRKNGTVIASFPNSTMVSGEDKNIRRTDKVTTNKKPSSDINSKKMREDDMMNRMMGGSGSRFSKFMKKNEKNDSKGGSKPLWFKK